MFALTSTSSALARSRVASAAAFGKRSSSRLVQVVAKKNVDSASSSSIRPMTMMTMMSTKDKDVALKATVLMMANHQKNKRASSTIVNSTASGANPEPTVKAAGGIADWPLEKKFVGFCFAMFGFFAFFMLMPGSAQLWFGPNPPFPKFTHVAMSYWNVDAGGVITNWWSRMTGVLFLSFLGGPFLFGAEITKAYLKQVTAMLCGHLALFVNVTFFSPVAKVAWYPQVILQVALVAMGLKLINDK